MQISIKSDIAKAVKFVGAYSKQIPFATSVAMNKTINQVQTVEQAAMRRELDQPRPATIKGIRVKRSTKRKLEASVFVIPGIDQFLRYQVVGGTRPPRGRAEAVPVGIKLNQYGNIPGRRQGKLAKLLARPDTFSGTVKGVSGIWQRGKGKQRQTVKLLASYQDRTKYKPRFHFYQHAERTVARRWASNFNRSIAAAIRTAR